MSTKGNFSVFNAIMVVLCGAYQIWAQDNPEFHNVLGKLSTYSSQNAPEKVYLQTDKDYYTNGETIWFRTYIVNGITHEISDKSRVVYVELTDPNRNIVAQRKVYAGFDKGAAEITLANDIGGGNYLLRAYTKYMLNDRDNVFFQKEIPVWTKELNSKDLLEKASKAKERRKQVVNKQVVSAKTNKPVVQFFPEGGKLVSGFYNVLGLKILDEKGKGIALTGKIIDQNDALISMFGSFEFGLGRVQFKVAPNTDYYAEIEIDGRTVKYSIPKPVAKGYVLQINNKGEYIQIRVSTNINDGLNGSLLLGHLRGKLILKHLQKNITENTFELNLSTAELKDGVASFTLFTPKGEPVCERLVFLENPDNKVNLTLQTDKTNYGFRKKVSVELAVEDEDGMPLNGNFSMSVSSQKGLKEETKNIESCLLLNSDLRGTVAHPDYFFIDDSKKRKSLLDILMLTHSWGRFVWRESGTTEVNTKLEFQPEKGIVINGKTVRLKNRQEPLRSSVRLTITKPSAYEEHTSTDSQGKFSFGPMVFRDSVKALITAENETAGKNEVAIYLEPSFPEAPFNDSGAGQPYFGAASRKNGNEFEYDPEVIKLDEAIGKARVKTQKGLIDQALNSRTMYGRAQNRIIPDSIPDSEFNSVMDLIERNVAGVRIIGSYPYQRVRIRPIGSVRGKATIDRKGMNNESPKDPLYLLDGIAVSPDLIQGMFASEVLFIDVLKNAGEIAQYGIRGANGVIAVYTDRGENYAFVQEREPDATNFTVPGFYSARAFYAPDYSLVKPEHDTPDVRTTLYWEPDIKINGTEQTSLSFYTADTAGEYTIKVEGLTSDGRAVSGLYSFNVGED